MTPETRIVDPHGDPIEPAISDKTPVSLGLVIGIVVLVVGILVSYNALDKRVSAMEDKTNRFQSDLLEIKVDLKTLLRNQQ